MMFNICSTTSKPRKMNAVTCAFYGKGNDFNQPLVDYQMPLAIYN